MPSRYTNEEWDAIIAQIQREIQVSHEPYPCPEIGSPAFLNTIDHTLLKLEATAAQIDQLCAEARVDQFAVCRRQEQQCILRIANIVTYYQSVCVRPRFVQKCKADLKGSNVMIDTVIGFHEGDYDLYYKLQWGLH